MMTISFNSISRHGLRAVSPLLCPYWGPDSSFGIARESVMASRVGSCGIFSRGSPISSLLPINIPLFNPPLPVISYSHSFIHFMSSSTSFMVRKNSRFDMPPVYNHTGCKVKRNARHVLVHWILSVSEIVYGKMSRELLMSIL